MNLVSVISAVTLALLNLVYAGYIYITLQSELPFYEPSGMQLIIHFIITLPITLISTAWLAHLSNNKSIPATLWKINILGILIPIMSAQTGITFYGFDRLGLLISLILIVSLIVVFTMHLFGSKST